jgi:hypothetical protein
MFISFIAIFFINCGNSDDANFVVNSEETISKEDRIAQNPNYELYDEECKQTDNKGLCGYVGIDGPPSLPCVDKTYCLPE